MTTDTAALRAAAIKFDDFLNEPPSYEEMRMVRDYRHEAYAHWRDLANLLRLQLDELDQLRAAAINAHILHERMKREASTPMLMADPLYESLFRATARPQGESNG